MIFKRKIYDKLLEWKSKSNGKKAILIERQEELANQLLLKKLRRHLVR